MSLHHSPKIVTDGLLFYYDQSNTQKSWKGKPTTNLIYSIPLPFNVYAYATGPVQTNNVSDASFKLRTVNRYTISQVVNTSRASLYYYSLSVGTSYAFSFKWKYNGTNTVTPNVSVSASKEIPEGTYNTFSSSLVTTTQLANGWKYTKYEFTVATSVTNACKLTYGIDTGTDTNYLNNTFDIYEEQFEVSSIATPFVNGTRSNTQAILDLTNNNTITANSLTYASDGSFSFDGDNQIATTSFNQYLPNMTWSAWIYPISNASSINMFMGYHLPYFGFNGGNSLMFSNLISGTQRTIYTATNLTLNTWYYATFSTYFDGTNTIMKTYTNGIESASGSFLGQQSDSGNNFSIGDGHSTVWYRFNGKIPIAQIYNRCLSATEVSQNFNATRSKYGI